MPLIFTVTEIGFYHLTRTPLEKALPRLLEKVVQAGNRVVLLAGSSERVDHLNGALWTYHPQSFLPHGTPKTGRPEEQPIWLDTQDHNPNKANVLVMVDGMESQYLNNFDKAIYMFDGNDPQAVAQARASWKKFQADGHGLIYWQQDEKGGWGQKS